MMKKMLLTLTAAGMLAVPAGVALAQDDGAVPTEPVATCEDHERSQGHNRLNERDLMAVHSQERAQHQFRINDGDCTGDQARAGTQLRLEDGTGSEAREALQVRLEDGTGSEAREALQVRLEDGTGSQAQYRQGEMGNSDNSGDDS